MRNRGLLGAGIALAMALGGVQAHAQFFGPYPPGAFYLGPEGGWTKLQSQTNTLTIRNGKGTESVSHSVTGNFDSGFNAGVRAGYMWGPWRFEEEYSYRFNSLSSLSPFGGAVTGNTHSNAIMTNALFDFTLGWPITPHIGGGVGAVNIDTSASSSGTVAIPTSATTGVLVSPRISTNRWEFGYQGIAGIRYLINPALALDIDYRYFATPSFTTTQYRIPATNGTCCFAATYKSRVQSQNIVASITMLFGAPPPAAPPPAPPAPPPPPTHQVYLVFFDWDKYNITPEGMQILEAAAAHWKAGGAVQIQVTGYTDLTGSAGYNQRLSERRAGAVAAVLERLGIPRAEMAVAGRGMNDPRVPTPLGVREPQNRRVEIVFP
jgi:outer membrane protein OmpA-like peptidoglycan-associated protein